MFCGGVADAKGRRVNLPCWSVARRATDAVVDRKLRCTAETVIGATCVIVVCEAIFDKRAIFRIIRVENGVVTKNYA